MKKAKIAKKSATKMTKKTKSKSKPKRARAKVVDLAKTPTLSTFTLRTKLVEKGSRTEIVAKTNRLAMQIRVYSPHEGKNGFHAFPNMDHSFIVLQGRARFYGPRGESWDVTKNQGILVPSGAYYCFENSGDNVLVILRAASFDKRGGDPFFRVNIKGEYQDSHHPENLRPITHVDSNQYFE